MIFKQEMVDAILSGRKTVTRRPVKYGTKTRSWAPGPPREERVELPCRYEVGKTYAVQPGRGKKGVARIRVLSVETAPLGLPSELSKGEIRREGFSDLFPFVKYWWKLYTNWEPDQLVHRIEFELVPTEAEV